MSAYKDRLLYDKATWALNLRKRDWSDSDAFPCHDVGCARGTWDSGNRISFDHNNAMMSGILFRKDEDQALYVIRKYMTGVGLEPMRWKWHRKYGPYPDKECEYVDYIRGKLAG